MVATPLVYDPYDYTIDANPHPVWKRLRDEAPVYYNEQHDFYALSRFDDVLHAHLDPATFSSAHTTVLEMMEPEPIAFMTLDDDLHGPAGAHALPQAREPRSRRGTCRRSNRASGPSPGRFLDEFAGGGWLRLRRRLRRPPARHGHLRAARRAGGGRGAAARVDRRDVAHRSGRDHGRTRSRSATRCTTTGRRTSTSVAANPATTS